MKSIRIRKKIIGTLAILACLLSCLAFAQDTAVASDAVATAAAPSSPWYLTTEFFAALITLVTGGLAVWQNKEKKTAQKVSETLVIAIESATKIPGVADKEKEIKAKIKQKAEDLGVQPVLARLVKDLT